MADGCARSAPHLTSSDEAPPPTLRSASQLAVRGHIDRIQSVLEQGIAEGDVEQTIFDGGTDEGHDQCDHYFGDGVYVRSLLIPAGTFVVGKIHKQARVCIIAQGSCQFADEFQRQDVEAPWIGEFRPGTKTAVYAHTDTLWAACLGTTCTDAREAFDLLTLGTHDEYITYLEELEKGS